MLSQLLGRQSILQQLRAVPLCSPYSSHLLDCSASWAQHKSSSTTQQAPPTAAFNDYEQIFKGQPTFSLLRSLLVFRLCAIPAFVANAEPLLTWSRRLLGDWLVLKLITKHTFFAQFCAGETDKEVQERTRQLQARGIGSILDYAAEDDVKPENKSATSKGQQHNMQQLDIGTSTPSPPPTDVGPPEPEPHLSPASGQPVLTASRAVARQYSYQNEEVCDGHVKTFLSSIESAGKAPGQGFAAVKLTALGNPRLLERVSSAIREVRSVFQQWDTDGSGYIDREEFNRAYQQLLPDASEAERARVFAWMDTQRQGQIDYVAWCQRLSLSRMPEYAARIKRHKDTTGSTDVWQQSLYIAALTPEEVELLTAMRARLSKLADAARQADVKLMVDAEHTYMQPAIDHLTLELMRKYNAAGRGAIVYNTYQAYLRDSHARLVLDLERARREGYVLGAKLVRGAYLEMERARAASLGYPSPVWDTLQQTHFNYNRCMEELLVKVKQRRAEVLLGTHNQGSIEQAVNRMSSMGLRPSTSPVYFGQLLGMSDHLTQVLGTSGYHAYKYVPYGKIEQVIPYLLRRASENASIMQGTKHDVQLLQAELKRRMKAGLRLGRA